MKIKLTLATLTCLALMATTPASLRAATLNVTNGADSGPGTLRDTLASAANGDTINFSLPTPAQITLTSGELLVNKSVTIAGPGSNLLAIADNPLHIGSNTVVSISGLTIHNAHGHALDPFRWAGGAIYNDHASLTISNCILTRNSAADFGGGISNDGSDGTASLEIVGSTLDGNFATIGGAIFNNAEFGHARLRILSSTISGNTAHIGQGGGIYNDGLGGTVEIIYSTLRGNQAGGGGGIWNNGGTLTVSNSTFNSNSGGEGPGIANSIGSTLIVSSTLSDNGGGCGGGIFNGGRGASVRILNCTLSGNSAGGGGCAILDNSASIEIGGTILNAGARGGNIFNYVGGTVTSLGYNLSSDDGGGVLTNATDQINSNPRLGPLQDNGGPTLTHALLCGSPAIDRGRNFSASAADQRGSGFVRTFDNVGVPNAAGGDGTDIGAFESSPPQIAYWY